MADTELLFSFERLLQRIATPAALRDADAGGSVESTWEAFEESGFLDAMVPEEAGGAGLSMADCAPLFQALGHYPVSVPCGETIVARSLLAAGGVARPSGPILLLTPFEVGAGYVQQSVPVAQDAAFALVELVDRVVLIRLDRSHIAPVDGADGRCADVAWAETVPAIATLVVPACGLRAVAAVLHAAQIAGAADQVLQMTTRYANDRIQFGKPIGKLQVIQQQLAILAEHTIMTRIASQIGCAQGFPPPSTSAAIAKQVTSAAVKEITAIAHAVHGAIGISEAFDLHLFTDRLHQWRRAGGSESYWGAQLGRQRLRSPNSDSSSFIREILQR